MPVLVALDAAARIPGRSSAWTSCRVAVAFGFLRGHLNMLDPFRPTLDWNLAGRIRLEA